MIGIDTNVLVRHLVQDDAKQSAAAAALLQRECTPQDPGLLTQVVLCELVWVLTGSYGYDRAIIARTVRQLLLTQEFTIEGDAAVRAAVADYAAGSGDFADYLLAQLNHAAGAKYTATFDRKAVQHPFFKLVK